MLATVIFITCKTVVPEGRIVSFALQSNRDAEVFTPSNVGRLEVQFHRVLGDPVRILGLGNRLLRHGELVPAVDGDRGGEDEALHPARVNRGVDEVDAGEEVVVVVEAADEVAQALGGVGGQVEDVLEGMIGEQLADEGLVGDRSLDERGAGRDVLHEPPGQVIHGNHLMPCGDEMLGDMTADETSTTSDQYLAHVNESPRPCEARSRSGRRLARSAT